MIKVGFVTTPLTGGHAARGIGFYTRNLLAGLVLRPVQGRLRAGQGRKVYYDGAKGEFTKTLPLPKEMLASLNRPPAAAIHSIASAKKTRK